MALFHRSEIPEPADVVGSRHPTHVRVDATNRCDRCVQWGGSCIDGSDFGAKIQCLDIQTAVLSRVAEGSGPMKPPQPD